MSITPIRVNTLAEAQHVRSIRNSVRQYMTRNNAHITPEQQAEWFTAFKQSTGNELWLYQNEWQCVIGYGYIATAGDDKWGTLALYPEYHSMGYGTEIYEHLIKRASRLYIEIFADNNASLIAALKSGFVIQTVNDKTITLKAGKA